MYIIMRITSLFFFGVAGFGVLLALLAVVTPHPASMVLFTLSVFPIVCGTFIGSLAADSANEAQRRRLPIWKMAQKMARK